MSTHERRVIGRVASTFLFLWCATAGVVNAGQMLWAHTFRWWPFALYLGLSLVALLLRPRDPEAVLRRWGPVVLHGADHDVGSYAEEISLIKARAANLLVLQEWAGKDRGAIVLDSAQLLVLVLRLPDTSMETKSLVRRAVSELNAIVSSGTDLPP